MAQINASPSLHAAAKQTKVAQAKKLARTASIEGLKSAVIMKSGLLGAAIAIPSVSESCTESACHFGNFQTADSAEYTMKSVWKGFSQEALHFTNGVYNLLVYPTDTKHLFGNYIDDPLGNYFVTSLDDFKHDVFC